MEPKSGAKTGQVNRSAAWGFVVVSRSVSQAVTSEGLCSTSEVDLRRPASIGLGELDNGAVGRGDELRALADELLEHDPVGGVVHVVEDVEVGAPQHPRSALRSRRSAPAGRAAIRRCGRRRPRRTARGTTGRAASASSSPGRRTPTATPPRPALPSRPAPTLAARPTGRRSPPHHVANDTRSSNRGGAATSRTVRRTTQEPSSVRPGVAGVVVRHVVQVPGAGVEPQPPRRVGVAEPDPPLAAEDTAGRRFGHEGLVEHPADPGRLARRAHPRRDLRAAHRSRRPVRGRRRGRGRPADRGLQGADAVAAGDPGRRPAAAATTRPSSSTATAASASPTFVDTANSVSARPRRPRRRPRRPRRGPRPELPRVVPRLLGHRRPRRRRSSASTAGGRPTRSSTASRTPAPRCSSPTASASSGSSATSTSAPTSSTCSSSTATPADVGLDGDDRVHRFDELTATPDRRLPDARRSTRTTPPSSSTRAARPAARRAPSAPTAT